ncbi:MAG TPA: 3-oxoacyl-[acyl-carrier-protein] reductase [Armatimonadota bacterium]|jgi:3-oxoacyl-[acyl-carrier protein] reductase
MSLKGKVALVTGGSGGIGRAVVKALAEAGADVAVNYSRNQQAGEAAAEEARQGGVKAVALAADISDAAQVEALVAGTLEQLGGVDILVNNSGVTRDALLMRMKEEDWDTVLDTNLKGAFLCSRAVVKHLLKQRGGRIINVSSVVGVIGNPGQANYCASKAGLIGLTKSLAKEVASRGVTVNAVAPGFIATAMTAAMTDDQRDQILKAVPLGTYGTPEDVAAAVLFLASDAARYVTGTVLQVDGGLGM